MGPTRENHVLNPLDELSLDNQLFMNVPLSWAHDAPASINGQGLSRDERGCIRGQKGYCWGHFINCSYSTHGMGGLAVLQKDGVPKLEGSTGYDM